MTRIKEIKCREILDSRGNPTLETTVTTDMDKTGTAAVPSGASKGRYEAAEIRDGDINRYSGNGVLKAVHNVSKLIGPSLIGTDVLDQNKIDESMIKLDGSINKGNLGANAILSISLACTRAAANTVNKPLYLYINSLFSSRIFKNQVTPMFNIINGGLHGNKNLSFQEFLIVPGINKTYLESLTSGVEIYQTLKKYLKAQDFITSVGDEGGFTPQFTTNEEALDTIIKIINKTKYRLNKDIFLGLDLASSTFFSKNKYCVNSHDKSLSQDEYLDYLLDLQKKYDLFSFEDPFSEDDWSGWSRFTRTIGGKCLIIGDDLLVTSTDRLEKAIKEKSCNSILIKVNQIGTLTETLKVIKLAKKANFKIIVSHRSGETNDDFISDLAVGTGADFVKFGAPARGERVSKYNRLKYIYETNNFQ